MSRAVHGAVASSGARPGRGNLAFYVLSVLFLGYVGYLFVANYHSLARLNELTTARFASETEQQRDAAAYYLSERVRDIRSLAARPEFESYFNNRALGMTMQYGLRASLSGIGRLFSQIMAGDHADELGACWVRLRLADTEGRLLVDRRTVVADADPSMELKQLEAPTARVLQSFSSGYGELVVSVPVVVKDDHLGQIMGWFKADDMIRSRQSEYSPFGQKLSLIVESRQILASSGRNEGLPLSEVLAWTASQPHDASPGVREFGNAMAAFASIPGTRFALVAVAPSTKAFTRTIPIQHLVGVLALFGIAAIGLILSRRFQELKRHEEAAHTGKERLQAIFNAAEEIGFVLTDLSHFDNRVVDYSPGAERIFGYKKSDVLSEPIGYYGFPRELMKALDSLALDHIEPERMSGEAEFARSNGARFPALYSIHTLRDASGVVVSALIVVIDITEQKAAEGALRASEANYRSIVDNMQEVFCRVALDGTVGMVSPSGAALLAFERVEEIIGTNIFGAPYVEPSEAAALLQEFMQTGRVAGRELGLRRKDGHRLTVLVSGCVIRDDAGTPTGIEGVLTDITDRKLAETALSRAKDELEARHAEITAAKGELEARNAELNEAIERANELALQAQAASVAKSNFLATMSHEIRTPMNGVIAACELLLGTRLDPDQHRFCEIIRSSGEGLLSIINDVLDFSKIEAGRMELEKIKFDLRAVIEDPIQMLSVKAQEKGIELSCLIEPDVPTLLIGDPGRLRQIVVNLVGNSIKFTDEGDVSVRVSRVKEENGRAELRFEIRDTGIGIPPEKIDQLFCAFTQADGSHARKYGGTGLGLAICQRLVSMMGGEIDVASTPEEGSCFSFTAAFACQTERHAVVYERGDLEGVRVLVVDDNETNRMVVSTMLRGWGCRVLEAENAERGMALLNEAAAGPEPVRIALLDMQMPVTTGPQMGAMMKADHRLSEIKLVLLSSVAQKDVSDDAKAIGFDGYLSKPLRQQQLYECLRLVLCSDRHAGEEKGLFVTGDVVAEASRPGVRLLLVEDNFVNREVALAMLKKIGFAADVALNGVEALKALGRGAYDLVFMDCQMPEMDGFEATRRIRSQTAMTLNPKVPIIAMTANAMEGDREACLNAGMDDYVSKPINAMKLHEVIERWTGAGEALTN